jgi:hypothetical protein
MPYEQCDDDRDCDNDGNDRACRPAAAAGVDHDWPI